MPLSPYRKYLEVEINLPFEFALKALPLHMNLGDSKQEGSNYIECTKTLKGSLAAFLPASLFCPVVMQKEAIST